MERQCDSCGERPAVIRITEVARGKVQERVLCRECASKIGVEIEQGHGDFSVPKLIAGIGERSSAHGEGQENEPVCASCGLTYAEFRDSGKLGCAKCYEVFGKELSTLIRRLHGTLRHTGRGPGEKTAEQAIQLELDTLRNQLSEAVAKEAYEEAATIRDRIRELRLPAGEPGEEG